MPRCAISPRTQTASRQSNCKSNFLGTALEGDIVCTATPAHLGRTTQVWDAEVRARAQRRQDHRALPVHSAATEAAEFNAAGPFMISWSSMVIWRTRDWILESDDLRRLP